MLRVAWIHTHMKFWGGGNRQVLEVAKRLSRRFDLMLFLGPTSALAAQKMREGKVNFTTHSYLSTNSAAYWALAPIASRAAAAGLGDLLSEYDAVITSYQSANMIGSSLRRPVVYYCFEPFSLFYNQIALNSLPFTHRIFWKAVGSAYRKFDFSAVRRAKLVLTIDRYTAKSIRSLYGRNSLVTGTGVDVDFFRPLDERYPPFERYTGKRVILSQTHGYSEFDGCEYLLGAAARLRHEFPNLHIIFTSMFENPDRVSKLVSLSCALGISSNVEFLGFVSEMLLPYYYSLASLVVQPAIGTNTLLTTKEAMACERPIVLFDGGPAEDIEGCDCGIVVKRQSVVELSEAIRKILGDPDLATAMGKKGRKRAIEAFSWDAVSGKVEGAVTSVLQ